MFQNTLNLISQTGIIFNHIFPYSIRKGTPAAKMPQVRGEDKKERAQELRAETKVQLHKFLDSQIGTTQKAIIEKNNIGRCENFTMVKIDSDQELKSGDIVEVEIAGRDDDLLSGVVLG